VLSRSDAAISLSSRASRCSTFVSWITRNCRLGREASPVAILGLQFVGTQVSDQLGDDFFDGAGGLDLGERVRRGCLGSESAFSSADPPKLRCFGRVRVKVTKSKLLGVGTASD